MKHKATITFIIETNDEKYWKEILEIKKEIDSGELQRNIKYDCVRDVSDSSIKPRAKIKATFKEE